MSLNTEQNIDNLIRWAKDPDSGQKPLSEYLCTLQKLKASLPECATCPEVESERE